MEIPTRHTPEEEEEMEKEMMQRLEEDNEWLREQYNEAKSKAERADELETELQSADRAYERLQNDKDNAETRLRDKLATKLHQQKQHFARMRKEDKVRIRDLEAEVTQLRAQITAPPLQATLEEVLRDMKRLGLEGKFSGENKHGTTMEDDDEPSCKRKRKARDPTAEPQEPEPSYLVNRWGP
ncbi:uncharacterized protein ALTATR162_LOCUS6097 [Alternaria atra]|uniref:Uncharacterized protein n=1 Tax=Alternaria atra TaxID=119953 RepID=A0A8J2IAP1_9PLEO|nr:uncharacterized protein ALTATR162_LOCUS6097 [Alternaria atra]CAG5161796.1 unnamed protein product [Alternaria atra]